MRIYYWLVWKINLLLGNLFYPGLERHDTWRYEGAMSFWSRSYGYGQEYFERWERKGA
jgi:hypothetical protein